MDEKKKPDLCSIAFSKVTEQMVPVTTSVIMEAKKHINYDENQLVSAWLMESVDFEWSLEGWIMQTGMEKAIQKMSS